MRLQTEIGRSLRGENQLIDGPGLALVRVVAHRFRRETVEGQIIRRMDRHELALQMCRQLSRLQPMPRQDDADLIAIGLAFRRAPQVEQPWLPARYLHALVTVSGRPAGNAVERVERRGVADELRQEYRRSLDRLHG